MKLNALIRGQSNALLLMEANGWAGSSAIIDKVEQLLGFDGVQDKVVLEYSSAGSANTVNSGTAFLKDWIKPDAAGTGWQVNGLEQGLLNYIGNLPAAQRAEPTAVVWLHSEYDSTNGGLTAQRWESGVRYDAALVRQAFGKSAADLPYMFVSAIPYWGTDQGHQAIRQGMEHLAADAGFNASIAARALDIDMSNDNTDGNWNTVDYGGPHMAPADGLLVAERIARSLAQEWAEYARPGSPVALAGGQVDNLGPQVVQAAPVGGNQLALKVKFDAASSLAALDPDAAAGTGWAVHSASGKLHATAVQVTAADTLLVTFNGAVPAEGLLHYGHGYGMLGGASGGGRGNAVYDDQGLPIWVAADGLKIGGGAAAVTPTPVPTPTPTPVPTPTPIPTPTPSTDWAEVARVVQAFYDANGTWASYEDILATQRTQPAPAPATPPAPTAPAPLVLAEGSGPDTLVLKVSQDAWQGSAQYAVKVDGVQLGGVRTAAAWHGAGQADTLTLKGDWAAGDHKVELVFLNDAWGGTPQTDRNLYLDGATYNGTAVPGATAAVPGSGTPGSFTFRDGAGTSFTYGTPGNDAFTGGAGRDVITGAAGNDVLAGGGGADQLFGNAGADTLRGELGNDLLNGGGGSDGLTGGAGADIFALAAHHGADRITDFTSGVDKLRFGGLKAADIATAPQGTGLLLSYAGGSVFLEGVQALGAGDMAFI